MKDSEYTKMFCQFCARRYGADIRKTAFLAAVWRAEEIERVKGDARASRVRSLLKSFASYCLRAGVRTEGTDTPLWEVAANYFGGLGK